MATILDQYGNPIDRGVLTEPQTSRVSYLQNTYLTPMLAGLTPARLQQHLRAADDGDLTAQHRLFADMEERDGHLLSEMNKRHLAVMKLDWEIVPPRNATAAETAHAEWLDEVLNDAIDPLEDAILALMGGVGHGYAPVELEWRQEGKEWLPSFHPRPQEWLRLDQQRRELRLIDASANGAALQPFGWLLHTHGKAKTGYIGRMGLHRALVWPFIYKAYALGDFAEFIETYGLPMIVGKYYNGAKDEEKASLMRAVTALGHDARAIMPADMQIEIQKIAGGGDSTPHMTMMAWAEASESKLILGQTMSAEAKSSGMGSGNADLHGEVRDDIRDADARQIAGTLTRDLLYPLLALNRGGVDSLRRCPRIVFDTGEAEDMASMADSLPKLISLGGMRIEPQWVHEKLRIPMAEDGKEVLTTGSRQDLAKSDTQKGLPLTGESQKAAMAALTARLTNPPTDPTPIDPLAKQMAEEAQPGLDALLNTIRELVATAPSLEALSDALLAAFGDLPSDQLAEVMSLGFALADLAGRSDVADGQ